MVPRPIDGAVRVGHALASAAVRHGGRCTWIGDETVSVDGAWRARAAALGPELASGVAGIGWFLARIARATGTETLGVVAVEALRSALDGIDPLLADGRLGFHDGALGIVWAALDAGLASGLDELVERALGLLECVEQALAGRGPAAKPTLLGGDAGVMTGLLALADLTGKPSLLAAAARLAADLAPVACALDERALGGGSPWSASGESFVGLAQGASGLALPLIAFGRMAGDQGAFTAAARAARAERVWCAGPAAWSGPTIHPWQEPAFAASSWCGGAAGIGQARLLAHRATGDLQALADASAAIEAVRAAVAARGPRDVSLCHGLSGWLDLFVTAGVALGEPTHLDAAGSVGAQLLALIDPVDGASPPRRLADTNPSLQLGAAGVGAVLLRLDDPVGVPSPLTPFVADAAA